LFEQEIVMSAPEQGLTATLNQVVSKTMLASHVGSGSEPVFATPELVLLVEKAAVAALADHLPAGQTSVGTRLDISHLAATPPGMEVSATALLTKVEGRKLEFEVEARDARELIAKGSHTRYLVDAVSFTSRASDKLNN
jgi:fluoroacetyl-CoA thioesterase